MEMLLTAVAVSLFNVICLVVGLKAGLNVANDEGGKAPNLVEKVKERREKKEAEQEYRKKQEAVNIMLHNIDVYDGTQAGQKDINY